MKNRGYMAILGILVLLGGCRNLLSPGGDSIPGDRGRLVISVENGARTALPSGSFDRYMLRFVYAGSEGHSHEAVEWRSGLAVDLDPGNWTIIAEAYAGDTLSGTGSATVMVRVGMVTPLKIRIGSNSGEGTGTLTYKVSYPQGPEHSYGAQTLIPRAAAGSQTYRTETISNGVERTISLPAGVYFVDVSIVNTLQGTGVTRTVAAHIYGGRETRLEISIDPEEFSALVPISLTMDLTVPGGSTVESRRVSAYYGDDFGELLGEAEAPATSGLTELVMWAPSKNLYPAMDVRFIQDIRVDGHDYSGLEAETVIGDPSRPFSFAFGDVYYNVVIAPVANGTIISDKPLSTPSVFVALTVSPASGYALKKGDFQYHQASNNTKHPITGVGSSYAFTMPESNVTVEGMFATLTRHVKVAAAGTTDGSSWDNASDDLQKMMDELAELRDDLSLSPPVVKLAAGTYKPKYAPNSDGTTNYATTPLSRDSTFMLREGVEVRGGYEGTMADDPDEPTRKARFNPDGSVILFNQHGAILSGEIQSDYVATNNAYHVVLAVNIPANSGTVLDGLTISGGYADASSFESIGGVTIYRNNGGGIYNNRASPGLNNVVISNNYTNDWGGGMINQDFSSPVLNNVVISNNRSNDWGGGMINWYSSSPVLNNVTISGNTAVNRGGGMYNDSSLPKLTNVTISGNTVTTGDGGGIYNGNSLYSELTNVRISGNSATAGKGGGMCNVSTMEITLTNVSIDGNKADEGGGMYNDGSSDPCLTNVTIAGNNATTTGGGIYNNDSWSVPRIRNSIIWGNICGNDTSGIIDTGGTSTVEYSDVQGWTVSGTHNLDMDPFFVSALSASSAPTTNGNYRLMQTSPAINGGSNTYYASGGDPDLSAITTDLDGGSRWQHGTMDLGAYESNVAPEMTRYVIAGGTGNGSSWTNASNDLQEMMDELAQLYDYDRNGPFIVKLAAGTYTPQYTPMIPAVGAPYVRDQLTIDPRDSAFILRPGVEVWGGYSTLGDDDRNIALYGTTLSGDINGDDGSNMLSDNVYHVVLAVNIPANSGTALDGLTINGGCADNNTDNITVAVQIDHDRGGGIYNRNASPALTNVTISGNTATSFGSGIYNHDAAPTLANVTISGNTGSTFGGGMYNHDSSPVLTDVTISGNSSGGGGGGGMFNSGASPVLTDVTINSNTTTGNGGGMHNDSSSPVLTSVVISNNSTTGTTTGKGGGMFNAGASPVLINVTISNNVSTNDSGGGIYNNDSSSPVLINATIAGNKAIGGGGIYNNGSSPVLTNVLISGNEATSTSNGGGMVNWTASPVLTNVTIAGNKATGSNGGGGIYNDNNLSNPNIRNSIIWGNVAGTAPSGIEGLGTPVISYSIVEGSFTSGSWNGSAGTEGVAGSNKDTDPFFVSWEDPAVPLWVATTNGDYRLNSGSPAIDAGSDSYYASGGTPDLNLIDTDLDNTARIKGGTIDMGAYEKQ